MDGYRATTIITTTTMTNLPRHLESQASAMLDLSQSVRFDAFRRWNDVNGAESAHERFVAWQQFELHEPHTQALDMATRMHEFSRQLMGIYQGSSSKRGYTESESGAHPHTIGNMLDKIMFNCAFIAKYVLDCKSLLDGDGEMETDCALCLRPRKDTDGPNTRSRTRTPDDHVVCSRCKKSWCGLCAESMESESCPYCRKEW